MLFKCSEMNEFCSAICFTVYGQIKNRRLGMILGVLICILFFRPIGHPWAGPRLVVTARFG